jgi:hypothetical protein
MGKGRQVQKMSSHTMSSRAQEARTILRSRELKFNKRLISLTYTIMRTIPMMPAGTPAFPPPLLGWQSPVHPPGQAWQESSWSTYSEKQSHLTPSWQWNLFIAVTMGWKSVAVLHREVAGLKRCVIYGLLGDHYSYTGWTVPHMQEFKLRNHCHQVA